MSKTVSSHKAEITIYSTQHDIAEETTETVYIGEYRFLAETHVISYDEYFQEESNIPSKTTSLVKIGKDFIHIAKKGAITTQMQFERFKKYQGSYRTPFGSFVMLIDTQQLSIREQENEIFADIKYSLSLNQCPVSTYTVQIRVKK